MHYDATYWYFQSVLPPRFCDELIKYGKKHQASMGLIGNKKDIKDLTKKDVKNIQKKRKSSLVWLNDFWIYKEIIPYVKIANKNAGWNFHFNSSESCQFTKYSEGEYYGWHYDMFAKNNQRVRKLSVTCSLSDPDDYEGGDLEFSLYNPERSKRNNLIKCTQIRPKGSIVVFPSYIWHRVNPVIKGTRYSLVIWNQGDPFR
jgi:PKHD-type hydroxylase